MLENTATILENKIQECLDGELKETALKFVDYLNISKHWLNIVKPLF